MNYQIDHFIINSRARLVTRDGELISIPRCEFDCLCILLEKADQIVSRDELIRGIWKRDDISDNRLSKLIVSLRRLLGDSGMQQRFIRTVFGFGYQWIGPVVEKETDLPIKCDSSAAKHSASSVLPIDPLVIRDDFPVLGYEAELEKARRSSRSLGDTKKGSRVARATPVHSSFRLVAKLSAVFIIALMIAGGSSSVGVNSKEAEPASLTGVWVLPPATEFDSNHSWLPVSLMSIVEDRLRLSGIGTIPIEEVLSAIEFDGNNAADTSAKELFDRFDAGLVVSIDAEQLSGSWVVYLTATPPSGVPLIVKRTGPLLIEVLIAASDALLIAANR